MTAVGCVNIFPSGYGAGSHLERYRCRNVFDSHIVWPTITPIISGTISTIIPVLISVRVHIILYQRLPILRESSAIHRMVRAKISSLQQRRGPYWVIPCEHMWHMPSCRTRVIDSLGDRGWSIVPTIWADSRILDCSCFGIGAYGIRPGYRGPSF